jgi:hypothetical protein
MGFHHFERIAPARQALRQFAAPGAVGGQVADDVSRRVATYGSWLYCSKNIHCNT